MGRVFEKRKHKMFARYDKMAKGFTKLGKEIAIAVKTGGPNPDSNARLRVAIQNAKSINMPKDRIDGAIKRASSKEDKDLEEIVYEGYGPYGIGILLECATNNPTRTVANVRLCFSKAGGELGKTGSLSFMFERKSVFSIKAGNINIEELELELIDFGAEEILIDEEEIIIYASFNDFGTMYKALETKGLEIVSSELQRIPSTLTKLSDAQSEEIIHLVEKFEEDDDVQAVYHNLK